MCFFDHIATKNYSIQIFPTLGTDFLRNGFLDPLDSHQKDLIGGSLPASITWATAALGIVILISWLRCWSQNINMQISDKRLSFSPMKDKELRHSFVTWPLNESKTPDPTGIGLPVEVPLTFWLSEVTLKPKVPITPPENPSAQPPWLIEKDLMGTSVW